MRMKKRIYSFLTVLLLFVTACIDDIEQFSGSDDIQNGIVIPLSIIPRVAPGTENAVPKLRVIIFSTHNSNPYGTKSLISNNIVKINQNYSTVTYVGYNDIYVIGNEPVDLSNIQTPEELKKIQMMTTDSRKAKNFVFFKQFVNARIKSANEIYLEGATAPVSQLDVKLERTMAKLSIDFDLDTEMFEGITPTGVRLNLHRKRMEVLRIPKYFSLISQRYMSKEGYLEGEYYTLDNKSQDSNRFKYELKPIYLPEHLVEDNSYRTVLLIRGTGSDNVNYTYTIPIGDAMNSVQSHSIDWNVTRNRHYKLKIKGITSFGELEVDAKVQGWSEVNVPVEISDKDFLAISKQTIDVKSLIFPTYVRFASSGAVTVTFPDAIKDNPDNILKLAVKYDDDATKNSGYISLIRGNWNTGSDISYILKIQVGNISTNLQANLFKSEVTGFVGVGDWATAMGYPQSANTTDVSYYDPKLFKEAELVAVTGCRAYVPPGTDTNDPIRGKGCWRLSTLRENWQTGQMIPFWAIEQYDNDRAKRAYYTTGPGTLSDSGKTENLPYSCTLDIRPSDLSEFIVSDKDMLNIKQADASKICTNMGAGWRLPIGKELEYMFLYAGTNGLPNNFFADSYWGKDGTKFIVATLDDMTGSTTTDALRNQTHTIRCVKARF